MYRYKNVLRARMISGNALRSGKSLPSYTQSSELEVRQLLILMKKIQSVTFFTEQSYPK